MSNDANNPQNAERKNGHAASQNSERRPPKDSRFQKGRSGNPRGRPKKKEVRFHENPAMHWLLKPLTLTGTNGEKIEGRSFDLLCKALLNQALKANLKALSTLITLAGGPQVVMFTMMQRYEQEGLSDEEPEPDEKDSLSQTESQEKAMGSPACQVDDGEREPCTPDNSENGEDRSAARADAETSGRQDRNPNWPRNWGGLEAVRREIARQRGTAEISPEEPPPEEQRPSPTAETGGQPERRPNVNPWPSRLHLLLKEEPMPEHRELTEFDKDSPELVTDEDIADDEPFPS